MTDRNTYRLREDNELLEEAKYNPTAELAIVLAERLEEAQAEAEEQLNEAKAAAEDARLDFNQLDDKIYLLQQEIARNEITITSMAAEIAYLKEQQND
jgi:predicted  nucleic acid-binding Zn-ribbon protein